MSFINTLLSDHGILGLNARNLLYIKPFNPKKVTALADDKLKTKAFLTARGIPAAKIYARFDNREQIRQFDFGQLPDECVLKPNQGYGGEGIWVLRGRNKHGQFLRNGKDIVTNEQLRDHMEDILDGKYSLGGRRDEPFFEQILTAHSSFAPFRPAGLPDLRVIVFNLVPVMAMLRVPTGESDGKANVHLGGIGIGIDIATGMTTHATQYNDIIKELPHGGSPSGHQIPHWEEILLICSKIQYITNIGYLAVDITIDQQMGPALLEVNARAGLMVQVANLAPLRRRLERVQGVKVDSPEKGVRIGMDLFGQRLGADASTKDQRPVLGLKELVSFVGDGTTVEEVASIAPEHDRTVISPDFADLLKGKGVLEPDPDRRNTYRVKLTLADQKLQTVAVVGEPYDPETRISIGRRDLSSFLIDPSKVVDHPEVITGVKSDLRAVDKFLDQYDKELRLLKHIKPTNLAEERSRAEVDSKYNPVFTYAELPDDIGDMEKRLDDEITSSEPLGMLLEKKRQSLVQRIALLRSRGNAAAFTEASIDLFGKPSSGLTRSASLMLHYRKACELPAPETDLLNAEQVKLRFEEVLKAYSLHNWSVVIRPQMVADCTVGSTKVYVREAAVFAPTHVEALIKHEIETHVLTAENGDHQPYLLLRTGMANYLDTQEGLAVRNQNLIYGPYHEKRYNPPRNLLGCNFALKNSFAKTRAYLQEELGYDPVKALSQTISFKRGLGDTSEPGSFTKSIVYYRGWKAVEQFIKDGGDPVRLYVGKISVEDIDLVEKLPNLQKPLLVPDFMR